MQEGKFCTPPREANYWQKLQVALHVTLACLQQQRRSITLLFIGEFFTQMLKVDYYTTR